MMFESVKKAMIVGVVVAVGALAGPAMVSAEWSPAGSQEAAGTLTITIDANGITTTCGDVVAPAAGDVMLDTVGNGGVITSLLMNDCSTVGFPACISNVTASASSADPWLLLGDPGTQRVSVGNVGLIVLYSGGAACPLNGMVYSVEGAVTGDFDNSTSTVVFTNETGLVGHAVGPVKVNGSVTMSNGVQLL